MSLVNKELAIKNDKTFKLQVDNKSSKQIMGSGTSGIIYKLYNRNFIGIEKDIEYFNLAKKRLDDNNG